MSFATRAGARPSAATCSPSLPLRATAEEVHAAIAVRSPALDLAGAPSLRSTDVLSARNSLRSTSTQHTFGSHFTSGGGMTTGGHLAAADRARSLATFPMRMR